MELKVEVSQEYIDKIWKAVSGGAHTEPWITWFDLLKDGQSVGWDEGADQMTVDIYDPDKIEGEQVIRKTFNKNDIAIAYLKLERKTHCGGCDLIESPDDCTFDLVIQYAFFGEYVYG